MDFGTIVTVESRERGLAANVVCVACGERMIARKGDRISWHFAHRSDSCGESWIHAYAKEVIATQGTMIRIPYGFGGNLFFKVVTGKPEHALNPTTICDVFACGHYRLHGNGEQRVISNLCELVVEVAVTNPKVGEYLAPDIPAIEITIDRAIVDSLPLHLQPGKVRERIKNGSERKWLYDPFYYMPYRNRMKPPSNSDLTVDCHLCQKSFQVGQQTWDRLSTGLPPLCRICVNLTKESESC